MLMGHPAPIIARGREKASQGCFEGLTPVHVPIVVQELVACNSEVQEALADTPEVVQEIPQAGPYAFHRVTVHTHAVRVMTSILACTMVDRSMIIVGRSEVVDVVMKPPRSKLRGITRKGIVCETPRFLTLFPLQGNLEASSEESPDSSVKNCAPPFTLAAMMGLIVALRTFSSTSR
jgi:hypothetical protein